MSCFNPDVQCAPGKTLVAADTLSRHPLYDDGKSDTVNGLQAYVEVVKSQLPASDEKLREIKEATLKDEQMQVIFY